MPHPAVSADFLEPLYIELDFLPERSFDFEITLDEVAELAYFRLGQIFGPFVGIKFYRLQDLLRARRTNPINILEGSFDSFWKREINPRDTYIGHCFACRN